MVEFLSDELDRYFFRFDRDLFRLAHILPGEVLDPEPECGREEVGLALLGGGQVAQQLAQVVDESHVEHAVRLVDDEKADVLEQHLALLEKIDYPPRRAYDYLYIGSEHVDLGAVADAAVEGADCDGQVPAQLFCIGLDLQRQFSGRGQNEDFFRPQGRFGHDPLHYGYEESGRLACPRLGLGINVLAGEGVGEDHFLDRHAGREARFDDAPLQVGVKLEFLEFHMYARCTEDASSIIDP